MILHCEGLRAGEGEVHLKPEIRGRYFSNVNSTPRRVQRDPRRCQNPFIFRTYTAKAVGMLKFRRAAFAFNDDNGILISSGYRNADEPSFGAAQNGMVNNGHCSLAATILVAPHQDFLP